MLLYSPIPTAMENVVTHPSYPNLTFRIIAALGTGLFMVFYGSKLNPFEAVLMPDFYLSLLGSFVIALLLITTVHFATVALDKRLNWVSEFIPRVLLQLLLGFLFPCMLAYFLAAIYFGVYGLDINADTDYLTFDYPWVVTFLFFLNLYYGFHFAADFFGIHISIKDWKINFFRMPLPGIERDDIREVPASIPPKKTKEYRPPVILYQKDTIVQIDITEAIAFFYCVGKRYWAKSFNAANYATKQSLSEIEKYYGNKEFFRINRQVLLNRKIIAGYEENALGQTVVTLHPIPEHPGNAIHDSYFVVSKIRVKKFIRWVQS